MYIFSNNLYAMNTFNERKCFVTTGEDQLDVLGMGSARFSKDAEDTTAAATMWSASMSAAGGDTAFANRKVSLKTIIIRE